MEPLDLGAALRAAQAADPASLPDILLRTAAGLDATDVVVYLVDFAQTTLEPVPDRSTHAELPQTEEVATTMAGRAFVSQEAMTAERPGGVRLWVPIVEGSDRTGVLAVTVPVATDALVAAVEELGLLAGSLLATQARATDVYNLYRRRRSLSLAASMQWDLLPPLVLKTDRITIACLLEPAYEVGGDSFDYALNDSVFNIGVIDGMGHGVGAALIAALTIGSYRHDRREARTLEDTHANLDRVMATHFPQAFATGQLAQIDVDTGAMTWTNAGHPCPLLIRGGRVIRQLACAPTPPWGLGSLRSDPTEVATEALEPGDSILFYTDGVVEAQLPGGEQFGVDRLADLAGQHATEQLEPEEIVRQIVRSVIDHQDHELTDDATIALVHWDGPATSP
ncbi:MAG: protein serine/threonine phosphatase [Actinomycetia bacterium]|nr:protein serine/threonine phosphatase [Actinomycetes bacterium]